MLPLLLLAGALAAPRFLPPSAVPARPADSRDPTSSVRWRTGDCPIEATVADRLGLLRLEGRAGSLQLELQAGLFLGFDPVGELTFPLTTVDGLVALPLLFQRGPRWASLEWAHISAHYADGIRRLQGERPPEDRTYSREFARLLLGERLELGAGAGLSAYAGGRVLLHSLPELPPLGFQGGAVLRGPRRVLAAVDLQSAAETSWTPSVGALLGLRMDGPREILLALDARSGPEDTGQEWDRRDAYVGLLLAFPPGEPSPPARSP